MQKHCDITVLVTDNYGIYKNVNLQQVQISTGVMRGKREVSSVTFPSFGGLFCGVTAFLADNVDLKNTLVTLPPKNGAIQKQPRMTTWRARAAAKPEASPANDTQEASL